VYGPASLLLDIEPLPEKPKTGISKAIPKKLDGELSPAGTRGFITARFGGQGIYSRANPGFIYFWPLVRITQKGGGGHSKGKPGLGTQFTPFGGFPSVGRVPRGFTREFSLGGAMGLTRGENLWGAIRVPEWGP